MAALLLLVLIDKTLLGCKLIFLSKFKGLIVNQVVSTISLTEPLHQWGEVDTFLLYQSQDENQI